MCVDAEHEGEYKMIHRGHDGDANLGLRFQLVTRRDSELHDSLIPPPPDVWDTDDEQNSSNRTRRRQTFKAAAPGSTPRTAADRSRRG